MGASLAAMSLKEAFGTGVAMLYLGKITFYAEAIDSPQKRLRDQTGETSQEKSKVCTIPI